MAFAEIMVQSAKRDGSPFGCTRAGVFWRRAGKPLCRRDVQGIVSYKR